MKIIIAGDSYSTLSWDKEKYTAPHYSWAVEIAKLLPIINVAHSGFSMFDIKRSLTNKSWDLAIINLTTVHRLALREKFDTPHKMVYNNTKIAKELIALPNVYCWSPFPEWENYKGVDTILQPLEDELWWFGDPNRFNTVTGNHFTRSGNNRILKHMLNVIRDKKSASASRYVVNDG